MSINFSTGGQDYPAKIVQYLTTVKTDTASTTNDGDNPYYFMSLAITLKQSGNKVLVITKSHVGSNGSNAGGIWIKRDSTVLHRGDAAGNRPRVSSSWGNPGKTWWQDNCSNLILDTPGGNVTYYLGCANGWTAGTAYINRSSRDNNGTSEDTRTASSITLLEIEA